jgi:hypothetical protein
MTSDSDVEAIVAPILRKALGPFGLDALSIKSGSDHSGDPIILVLAKYKPNAPKLNSRVYLDGVVEAMDALNRIGDSRFIHVNNQYVDGEAAVDEGAKRRRAS